ncbi:MAG: hypothetical protein L0Y54_04555 [Sporichthyaceae bacterium]|nr:hypothetical protein [Sporichthyaceae bacterium]
MFNAANTITNLHQTTVAPELIEPAIVPCPEAGSRFQPTLDVDDVDALCAELATCGSQSAQRRRRSD